VGCTQLLGFLKSDYEKHDIIVCKANIKTNGVDQHIFMCSTKMTYWAYFVNSVVLGLSSVSSADGYNLDILLATFAGWCCL